MQNVLISILLYIYLSLCLSIIADKLGQGDLAVIAWIPFFNLYVIVKLADFNGLTFLLFFIPFFNYLFLTYCLMRISAYLDRNPLIGMLMFVPVVNLILLGYLAFTDSKSSKSLI